MDTNRNTPTLASEQCESRENGDIDCDAYLNAADLCANAGWTVGDPLPRGIPARIADFIAADLEAFSDRVSDAAENAEVGP